jgi:hypothetical protein
MADPFRYRSYQGASTAKQGTLATVENIFRGISADALSSQVATEKANALAAQIDEFSELQQWMNDNRDKPDLWGEHFSEVSEAMKKNISKDARSPITKAYLENKMTIDFAQLEARITEDADNQSRDNQEIATRLAIQKNVDEPPEGGKWTDKIVGERFKNIVDLVHDAAAAGDRKLQTPEQVDALIDKGAQPLIARLLMQDTEPMTPEEADNYLGRANEIAKELYGIDTLFTAKQIEDMKKKFKQQRTADTADSKAEADARNMEANNKWVKDIEAYVKKPLEEKSGYDISNEIANDQNLYPDDRRTLINWMEQRNTAVSKGKDDPLNHRQNVDLYWEDYQKAIDGEITDLEARGHVGKDGYNISDYKEIRNILNGQTPKSKANDTKTAIDDFNNEMDTLTVVIPADARNAAVIKGETLIEDGIKEAEKEGPMTRLDKRKLGVKIGRQMKTELTLGATAEQILPTELTEQERRIGKDATFPDGVVYGKFVKNPDDELNPDVMLNEVGVRWILERANGNAAEARKIAEREGYQIPK